MEIEKIEKIHVGDTVFEQLKQMILQGEWKPGDRIPGENVLVGMFGVSRVSVRAAIHQLVGMGVLTVRHGDGTYVADPLQGGLQSRMMQQLLLTSPQLREVLEFRMMTEVGSARLAAKHASAEDVTMLRQCEEAIRNAGDDIDAFAREDLRYHNTVALISGNGLMVRITAVIQEIYAAAMVETIKLRGLSVGRYNHTPLTNAIEDHNEEAAARLMAEHIQAILDLLPAAATE